MPGAKVVAYQPHMRLPGAWIVCRRRTTRAVDNRCLEWNNLQNLIIDATYKTMVAQATGGHDLDMAHLALRRVAEASRSLSRYCAAVEETYLQLVEMEALAERIKGHGYPANPLDRILWLIKEKLGPRVRMLWFCHGLLLKTRKEARLAAREPISERGTPYWDSDEDGPLQYDENWGFEGYDSDDSDE